VHEGGPLSRRAAYLELRRAMMALAPFAHGIGRLSSEVMFGPPIAADEGTGALGALDRALVTGDQRDVIEQLDQIRKGLELMSHEIDFEGVRHERVMGELSQAAYQAGLIAMEAYPAVPDGHDAVLADLHGLLDGIERLARAATLRIGSSVASEACAAVEARIASIRRRIGTASKSVELEDRASLVLESGTLGVALRRLARACGVAVNPPHRARYPVADNGIDEPVSAFTLPGQRVDLRPGDRQRLADLGKKLFFDRRLSQGDKRSCGDCHKPELAFSDGLRVPKSFDPKQPLIRNTPALLYAPLHAAQLWDGQLASAERQAIKVIHTRAEMGLNSRELEEKLAGVAEYAQQFSDALGETVTAANVARALVAYEVRDMVPGKAPIDRLARGDTEALSPLERRGLDLFAGKGRCARCHVPPAFAGTRPTDFAAPVFAALGVPDKPGSKKLDADTGRGGVTKVARDLHAFKTPTVRNIAKTAPYFHHGAFETLESVIDFYDKGGGKGEGIELPNQDPEVRKLDLTAGEKKALLALLRIALTD
jgi:cytochrome c peroxidase